VSEGTDRHKDLLDRLRLAMARGIGPLLFRRLVDRFGSPQAVLHASDQELLSVEGIGTKAVRAIAEVRQSPAAEEELQICRANRIDLLTDADFPPLLNELPDTPHVLFCRGELTPADSIAIGIVGTRRPTPYGIAQAERLAKSLARAGFTIVSGLARGIDAAAQRGALAAGGRTVAVLASGLLNIYPPEHRELADEVANQGALLSEALPRFKPLAQSFPQRNRLISGLSLGVIVVEAATRSGALITARHAMEQGREVFAVPGRVDNRMAEGCHRLIRDGARLVESPDDVLEELGPLSEPVERSEEEVVHHPAELQLNDVEKAVLGAVSPEPTAIDAVVAGCGLPVQRVLSTLSILEMRRLVRRVSGTQVARV